VFHPLGATLLTVLCGWLAVARADVALPMTEVAPGVYVHSGHHEETDAANLGDIANIGFVVGEKCAAVVDSGGSMQVGRALLAALRRLTDRPVCYVVNTHMHPDHVFGNGAFAQLQPRPRFVGSARLPRALAERGEHYLASLSEALGEAAAGTRVVLPDLTVDGEMPLDLGGRTLTLRTWPTAHTNNDLTVFDEASGSLWLGDLLFETRIPSIDGSLRGWLAVMGELRQLTVRHAIPGHGAVDRPWPGVLDAQQAYLERVATRTRAALAQGLTLRQAVDAADMADAAGWRLAEHYHRRNLTAAYAELEWE